MALSYSRIILVNGQYLISTSDILMFAGVQENEYDENSYSISIKFVQDQYTEIKRVTKIESAYFEEDPLFEIESPLMSKDQLTESMKEICLISM